MIPEETKKLFIDRYKAFGDEKFYDFLINYALNRVANGEIKQPNPATELLSYGEKFLKIYRIENDDTCLNLSRVCRRAAHKIYRFMLNKKMVKQNSKFLNLVENGSN